MAVGDHADLIVVDGHPPENLDRVAGLDGNPNLIVRDAVFGAVIAFRFRPRKGWSRMPFGAVSSLLLADRRSGFRAQTH